MAKKPIAILYEHREWFKQLFAALDERDVAYVKLHIYYYDINPLSNFVADAPHVLGFDPTARLVDFIIERAERGVV